MRKLIDLPFQKVLSAANKNSYATSPRYRNHILKSGFQRQNRVRPTAAKVLYYNILLT